MEPFEDNRPLPGGRISVDLLNTRWMSSGAPVDWLVEDDAVRLFADSHGVTVENAKVGESRRALVQAREVVLRLFETVPGGGVDAQLVADVDAILERANVRLTASDDGVRVAIAGIDGPHRLAVDAVVDAVDLLSDRPERIRSCNHEDCTLWFLDTSKAGRRRWCSMEQCGNRAKARRHYARTTQSAEAADHRH